MGTHPDHADDPYFVIGSGAAVGVLVGSGVWVGCGVCVAMRMIMVGVGVAGVSG
mgnify:CR=1 FL=1